MSGRPRREVQRHCAEMRLGTRWCAGSFGTACSHAAWQRPPMTSRSPLAGERSITPVGSSASMRRPVSGRMRNGRRAPRLSTPMTVSSNQRSSRSRCQATLSRPSR